MERSIQVEHIAFQATWSTITSLSPSSLAFASSWSQMCADDNQQHIKRLQHTKRQTVTSLLNIGCNTATSLLNGVTVESQPAYAYRQLVNLNLNYEIMPWTIREHFILFKWKIQLYLWFGILMNVSCMKPENVHLSKLKLSLNKHHQELPNFWGLI